MTEKDKHFNFIHLFKPLKYIFLIYKITNKQVVVSWACLIVFGTFKFLQWSNLLSSWKGLTFAGVGLAVVTVLMQILIQFSQADRSTRAKVAPARSNGSTSVQDKQQ